MVPIYFSERHFEVVTWGVGHTGLLLRSLSNQQDPVRIEILFKPAYALCLPSVLDGLHLTERRDPDRRAEVGSQMGRRPKDTEHVYEVATQSLRGWVVAGSVSGRRDGGGSDTPTMFDGWGARDDVEEIFGVNG